MSLTEIARKEAEAFARMDVAPLSLGVMCTVGPSRLIPLVNHLESQCPQINLTVRTSYGKEVIEWLLAGKVDAAIIGLPEYPDEIKVERLYSERYMIAFPKNHRFSDRETIPLRELNGENYVERLNCEYLDFFRSTLRPTLKKENPDLYKSLACTFRSMEVRHGSEHEDWIQAMVIAGMGCAVMPEFISLSPEMQMRPLVEPEIKRDISLAIIRGRKHTPPVRLFFELCTAMKWDNG
ncbi:MAG: LysR family transcriptional regulator substrate-binding protein [Granulosicoccus sp.]